MGVLEVEKRRGNGIDGKKVFFAVSTTTSDLSYPEHGTYEIHIWSEGEKNGSSAEYWLEVCIADYSDAWFNRFVDAFLGNPDWRERFRRKERRHHPATRLCLPAGTEDIDTEIAEAIIALNKAGAVTRVSCQGDGSSPAYIGLKEGNWPEELRDVAQRAGFAVNRDSIYADARFGLNSEAAEKFRQMLRDWANGALDMSAQSYRVTSERPDSRPKLPAIPKEIQTNKTKKAVTRLLKLGEKAKFRDYAELKSGRDEFSAMSFSELGKMVNAEIIEKLQNQGYDEKFYASVLRWVLRGLPPGMAARKVKTDLEIAGNARQKKKRP